MKQTNKKKFPKHTLLSIILLLCSFFAFTIHAYAIGLSSDEKQKMQEKIDSAKQYEMNIILETLDIKEWNELPAFDVEYDPDYVNSLTIDEPLGEYSKELLQEYTKEDIVVEIEYYYGNTSAGNTKWLTQIVQIYIDGEQKYFSYYEWGPSGVPQQSTARFYETYEIPEEMHYYPNE